MSAPSNCIMTCLDYLHLRRPNDSYMEQHVAKLHRHLTGHSHYVMYALFHPKEISWYLSHRDPTFRRETTLLGPCLSPNLNLFNPWDTIWLCYDPRARLALLHSIPHATRLFFGLAPCCAVLVAASQSCGRINTPSSCNLALQQRSITRLRNDLREPTKAAADYRNPGAYSYLRHRFRRLHTHTQTSGGWELLPLIISFTDDPHDQNFANGKAWEVNSCHCHFSSVSTALSHPKHELIVSCCGETRPTTASGSSPLTSTSTYVVQDTNTQFELALECGNLDVAMETMKTNDWPECWDQLAQQALKLGTTGIWRPTSRRRNFDKLSFMYLATGSTDKLSKMQKIADAQGDPMSRFHNALYVGDILGRISVMRDVALTNVSMNSAQEILESPADGGGPTTDFTGPHFDWANFFFDGALATAASRLVSSLREGAEAVDEEQEAAEEELAGSAPGPIEVEHWARTRHWPLTMLLPGSGNHQPLDLKPLFLAIYHSSHTYLTPVASLPPLQLHIRRNPVETSLHTLPLCVWKQLSEAQNVFRSVLRALLLVPLSSDDEAKQAMARAGHSGPGRKNPITSAENLELAAYFTQCKLRPPHGANSIAERGQRVHQANNQADAAQFAKRLLELKPDPKIVAQMRQRIAARERNPRNAVEISYDEFTPFQIYAASYTPIYKGMTAAYDPYPNQAYLPEFQGKFEPSCAAGRDRAGATGLPAGGQEATCVL
ncbi:coatomer WD associated region-domain-containing protein [Mycena olivaceomarginata]|nr:coatomer WD associated region-domain-containing protein [Mycena olivaceomarginata]